MATGYVSKGLNDPPLHPSVPMGNFADPSNWSWMRRFKNGPYEPNPLAHFQEWHEASGFGDLGDGTTLPVQTGSTDIWGWISQNLILVLPAVFLVGFLFSKQRVEME